MKNYRPTFQLLTIFLFLLLNFSVQGQPPPPGYKSDEVVIANRSIIQIPFLKETSSLSGPNKVHSYEDKTEAESVLRKIYKTFLVVEDNLRLSNSEKARVTANELVLLLSDNMEQNLDVALFEKIKQHAKLLSATNDLAEQRHYFSVISENMHQLLRIK